jgi:ubiquinone/menaquinone biosynthesis C-methylase UbiE
MMLDTTEQDTMPDFAVIKARQQATWASGDFARIGSTLQPVGESLCEAVDLRAGQRVLDVAAGNGNAALAAARCGCEVVATDYVPSLLEGARRRAEADGLTLRILEGDAEELPFANGEFDAALSTFGVMFAPDHVTAAKEIVRVCRPGGKVGLASWTPEGFIGELLKLVGRFVPPPPGVAPPTLWGNDRHLRRLFGNSATRITTRRRIFNFRYRSAEQFVQTFRAYYGPTHKAFLALDEEKRRALAEAIAELARRFDRADDGTLCAQGEYLETVIRLR